MKTTKYLLSALCLAALAAGCTKDSAMRTSSVEGLRISVTAASPSTRTALHEDGLSLLWEEGDQLQLIPTNVDNDNIYTLTLDEKSLSSDGTQADFVASQAIPEGEYYLASSNAKPGMESDPHTITFLYSDSKDAAASNITVTDATKNTHEGGLKTMALLSDRFAVSADDTEILTSLKHYSTLLELPILLTSNTTGADVTLNKITLEASSEKFPTSIQMDLDTPTETSPSLSVTFSDTPVLPAGEPYKAYMPLLAVNSLDLSGEKITITVSTSAGDFTFTKPGRTLEPGYRYTLSDLNIAAQPTLITSETEWNRALSEGKSLLTLGANVELTASATLPTYDITVTGNYALTMNVEGRTPSSFSSDILYIPTTNGRAEITSKLTLAGGADLVVKNGYLYLSDLEAGDGSELSSEGGRLVVTNALTVASGATATIASGLVASCKSLYREGATLTVNGKLYYGNVASGEVPSGDVAQVSNVQLPYSNFDNWYQTKIYYLVSFMGSKGWFVGESASAPSVWQSGNGNSTNPGGGGLAMAGEDKNPTRRSDIVAVPGSKYSVQMVSAYVTVSIADKFAAGNLFTGTYNETTLSPQGAKMTFGVPYGEKPIALSGYYRYEGGKIDYRENKPVKEETDDQCDLYIALSKKAYSINTSDPTSYPGKVAETDLVNDPDIVAYGRLTSSEATNGYRPFYIELTYKNNDFNPAEATHIMVVATSSKGGAQFTGSTSSVLYLDELNLEF